MEYRKHDCLISSVDTIELTFDMEYRCLCHQFWFKGDYYIFVINNDKDNKAYPISFFRNITIEVDDKITDMLS
jgi:hypothetical protein